MKNAQWHNPTDVLNDYNTADILGDNRVVFNIGGNKYRLVVRINYKSQSVYIRFIRTHNEYDKIDARTC
ncbi:MAG: type II toxin-antitoxin system HigB family toxin [Chloroflexota bacterium]